MPIYEYICLKCKHHFQKLQKINNKIYINCPKCKDKNIKKIISKSNFKLKGSGWYETDFKK